MKLVCVFAYIFVFGEISSLDAPDDNESTSLSSEELDKIQDIDVLRKHFKRHRKELKDRRRKDEILGFLCACKYLSEMNSQEYKFAKKMAPPGQTCIDAWDKYLNESIREPAIRLRLGEVKSPPLLQPSEYHSFSESKCSSYSVYWKHIHTSERLVAHLTEGSDATILEILEEEEPKHLLNITQMRFENLYAKAVGKISFPYLVLEKDGEKYAVPQLELKNERAYKKCATLLCKKGNT